MVFDLILVYFFFGNFDILVLKECFFFVLLERFFEDYENVVEVLLDWIRDIENKVVFLEKEEKYVVFKNF